MQMTGTFVVFIIDITSCGCVNGREGEGRGGREGGREEGRGGITVSHSIDGAAFCYSKKPVKNLVLHIIL